MNLFLRRIVPFQGLAEYTSHAAWVAPHTITLVAWLSAVFHLERLGSGKEGCVWMWTQYDGYQDANAHMNRIMIPCLHVVV